MSNVTKTVRRSKIRRRVRSKIFGTAQKPRLCVFKSSKHVYAQIIDDLAGSTLAAKSTLSRDLKETLNDKKRMEQAEVVGEELGKAVLEKGITSVVFDRSGYKYHGIVKKIADGARKAGLQF